MAKKKNKKKVVSKQELYICTFCDREYIKEANLKKHIKGCSLNPFNDMKVVDIDFKDERSKAEAKLSAKKNRDIKSINIEDKKIETLDKELENKEYWEENKDFGENFLQTIEDKKKEIREYKRPPKVDFFMGEYVVEKSGNIRDKRLQSLYDGFIKNGSVGTNNIELLCDVYKKFTGVEPLPTCCGNNIIDMARTIVAIIKKYKNSKKII